MMEKNLPDSVKPYYNIREFLATEDGLVLYGGRIVIPAG